MSRKIIEYFGGKIWLDTSYTDGARFLFTLPMPEETLDLEPSDLLEVPQSEHARMAARRGSRWLIATDPNVIDVLMVEDDEGDVLMTREAFEYYKIRNRLHVVTDGEQALQFLHRTGPLRRRAPSRA